MAKIKDLSPHLKTKLKTAEQELQVQYQAGALPFGDRVGGLQAYSASFKRGYGDAVFGSDNNGIWLGKADFTGAPFRVDMDGNLIATSATISGSIHVFKQATIPTSKSVGDVWFDTDDNNKVYRAASVGADQITEGEWEAVDDQRAADALLKAGTSQTLSGDFVVGSSSVKIDGINTRILINDGTTNRIVIGNV